MTAPLWITCPYCGEKRDISNRYTSLANARRDVRAWTENHESGQCIAPEKHLSS